MKRKTIEVYPELISRFRNSPRGSSPTLSAVNLRPCRDGAGLKPTGRPMLYPTLAGCRPLCRLRPDGADTILASAGRGLLRCEERLPGLPVTAMQGVLPGAALCAVATGADEAVVMTEGAPVTVSLAGGRISTVTQDFSYPAIRLVAAPASPVSTVVADRILSAIYPGTGKLEARDASAVSGDLAAGYLDLCASAAMAGTFIQPALVRYRLRDKTGRALFTSPPVLSGHVSGAQCASTIGLFSSDRQRVNSYTLTAYTWSLLAVLPSSDSALCEQVSQADIYMSPLFHPYHPDLPAQLSLGRGTDSSTPFIMAGLPGRQCGLGTDFKGAAERTIMKAIARMDDIEERVAVIANPFGPSPRTTAISCSPPADAASVSRALQTALKRPVKAQTRLSVLLGAPHTFSAACCAADASTVAWGNLKVNRYKAYPASVFQALEGGSEWTATTKVLFADGTATVLTEQYPTGGSPVLTPVLCYPAPDAVEMTISISCGGRTYTRTFGLSPDESGRFSVYVDSMPVPLSLPAGAPAATSGTTAPCDIFDGTIAFAPATSPLLIESTAQPGGGAVNNIMARAGSDQAWEFGRCRFVAGAVGGIYSIGVGIDRRSLSVRLLSSGGPGRPDGMAPGEGGELFVLAGGDAISGPALTHISASGRVEVFEQPRNYRALAYNRIEGELWAFRTDGTCDVFCRDREWRRYSRTDISATEILYAADEPYAVTAAGPVRICRESATGKTSVALTFWFTPNGQAAVVPRAIEADVRGTAIEGTLSLAACDSSGTAGRTISQFGISGKCLSALRLALADRPGRRYRVSLEADVSADFIFTNFSMTFDR